MGLKHAQQEYTGALLIELKSDQNGIETRVKQKRYKFEEIVKIRPKWD